MKRTISVMLVTISVALLTACGGGSSDDPHAVKGCKLLKSVYETDTSGGENEELKLLSEGLKALDEFAAAGWYRPSGSDSEKLAVWEKRCDSVGVEVRP